MPVKALAAVASIRVAWFAGSEAHGPAIGPDAGIDEADSLEPGCGVAVHAKAIVIQLPFKFATDTFHRRCETTRALT